MVKSFEAGLSDRISRNLYLNLYWVEFHAAIVRSEHALLGPIGSF